MTRETPDSDNDATCAELKADEGWKKSVNNSRPVSIASEPENNKWINVVSGKKKTEINWNVNAAQGPRRVHTIAAIAIKPIHYRQLQYL